MTPINHCVYWSAETFHFGGTDVDDVQHNPRGSHPRLTQTMPSQPPRRQSLATTLVVLASIIPSAVSFSPSSLRSGAVATPLYTTASSAQLSTTSLAASSNERNKDSININYSNNKPILSTLAALTILTTTLTTSFQTANAYEESDYASETVTTVVQQLKENAGDVDKTFGTLEEIAKIITEGKGVGGSLSYGELLHLCVCLLKCRAEVGLAVCRLSVLRGIATTHS